MNNELIKFTGIFENKEVRIKDGYISVFDILITATGCKKDSVYKTWLRIKKEYNDILAECQDIKFDGKKQKETPCINTSGFIKLLMIIPGKLADKFRNDVAPIIIRNLGGDTTLINEIKYTDQLHIQNGESNIFRKVVKKKLCYNEKYYMYVRVFSQFFADQQKNAKIDEKVRKLNWDIIKFGIAKCLDGRENSYSSDHGYFQFTIEVPSKECALFIEKISRQEFKDITVGNSFEYLDSKKLAKNFGIIKDISLPLEKRDYYLSAKELYTKMLIDLHMYYPELKDNFGSMNHPKAEEDSEFNTVITNSVNELTKEKLPNYILKECIIDNNEKIEKEIKKDNEIIEVNMNQETLIEQLNEELRLEKVKSRNLVNLIKKESPEIYERFITDSNTNDEHHKVWAKNKIFQYTIDGKFIKSFDSVSAVAKFNNCSPKAIRNHVKDNKCFNEFLWRSSNDMTDKNDLIIQKINQCDPTDFHIIKTFNNFEEITDFDKYKVHTAIDYGLIHENFRWKFNEDEILLKKQIGKTGRNKRLAKMNETKEIIEIFESLKLASENIKISNSHMSDCIKKNKLCGGFFWQYII